MRYPPTAALAPGAGAHLIESHAPATRAGTVRLEGLHLAGTPGTVTLHRHLARRPGRAVWRRNLAGAPCHSTYPARLAVRPCRTPCRQTLPAHVARHIACHIARHIASTSSAPLCGASLADLTCCNTCDNSPCMHVLSVCLACRTGRAHLACYLARTSCNLTRQRHLASPSISGTYSGMGAYQ